MQLAELRDTHSPIRVLLSGLLPAADIVRICSECRSLPPGTVRNHLVTEGFLGDMAKIAVLKAQTSMAGIPPAIKSEPVIQRLLGVAAALETNILDNEQWWASLDATFRRWYKRSNLELPADLVDEVKSSTQKKARIWLDSIRKNEEIDDTESDLGHKQRVYDIKKKHSDVSSHDDEAYAKEKRHKDREQVDTDARKKTKRAMKKERRRSTVDRLAQIISGGIDNIDAHALAELVDERGALEVTRLLKFLKDTGELKKLKKEDFDKFCFALLTEGPMGWLKKTFWDNPREKMKQAQAKAKADYDSGASQTGMRNFASMFTPESRKQLGRDSLRKAVNGWIATQAIMSMVEEMRKAAAKARHNIAVDDDASGPLYKREPDTGKKMPVPAKSPPKPGRGEPPPYPYAG